MIIKLEANFANSEEYTENSYIVAHSSKEGYEDVKEILKNLSEGVDCPQLVPTSL